MFTYTETPLKDIWEHIRFLSIENNCKRLLNGEIKSKRTLVYSDEDVLTQKSKEISMCLKQADEYFTASETTSINTSPLLLFYGMLSLAKALIVANKEELYLDKIKYHGLETRPRYDFLKTYNENPENWSIENEYALTNDGVFNHLIMILDNYALPNSSVIMFKDIIKCIPELWGIYEKYYNESSNIRSLHSIEEKMEPNYSLRLNISGKDPQKILDVIPELQNDFDIGKELYHNQAVVFTSKNIDEFPKYIGIYRPQFGGNYIIKGVRYFNGNDFKNEFVSLESLDYIAMYILSVCVRYKQVLWRQIISGEKSGSISLINLYLKSIKRRFPNIILNNFFNEKFIYGSSGYI
jgi:hypothetical protein